MILSCNDAHRIQEMTIWDKMSGVQQYPEAQKAEQYFWRTLVKKLRSQILVCVGFGAGVRQVKLSLVQVRAGLECH